MRSTVKKALSVLLAFMLCLSIIPSPALAEGFVAKIGETEYETLAAAVAAVQDGETITLTDNAAFTEINNGKTFTIDLNGHKLYVNGVEYSEGTSSTGEAIAVEINSSSHGDRPDMPPGDMPGGEHGPGDGQEPPEKPDGGHKSGDGNEQPEKPEDHNNG